MTGQYVDRREGFELIPATAKFLAGLFGLGIVAICLCIWGVSWPHTGPPEMLFLLGGGIVGGGFVAAYVLAAGYVYGDAARRGMPAGLWTLLVVLIPNCLGFVVYFLVRKSAGHPCPNCGAPLGQDALFCSRCGHQLMRPVA